MELTLLSKTTRIKKQVETDHYWYDRDTKQMLQGRGGRMEFIYDPIQKKSKPHIVDHEEWVSGNDYSEIKKWVSKNKNKFGITVEHDNGTNMWISININNFSEVQEDLYRNNIASDYDPAQLRIESSKHN